MPLSAALDTLSPDEIAGALEECGARISVDSLNWPDLFPYRPLTVITAAHSATAIYLDVLVRCNYLRAENYRDNSPVSEDSCVEFFFAPNPRQPADYYSFGVNCIGVIRASHHLPDGTAQPLSTEELATIRRYASVGTRPFREVEGSFIWSVSVAIPLELLGITFQGKDIRMNGNFNKCAALTSQPHYLSWSPIHSDKPDFHRPEAFASIILEGE